MLSENFSKVSPFIRILLSVLRKYDFTLRNVETDRSCVHVVTNKLLYSKQSEHVWKSVRTAGFDAAQCVRWCLVCI